MSNLFMRDGHLSDLSLERILAGELKDDDALRHVQTCTVCKARFEALQGHEQSFQAPRSGCYLRRAHHTILLGGWPHS